MRRSATGICTRGAQDRNSRPSPATGCQGEELATGYWVFSSVAALVVGDGGEDIGSGGQVAAVAISGGVGAEIVLRAGLVGVAGEVAAGVEVEGVGGGDAVLDQAEVDGLSVVLRLLVLFEVLVAGGGLGFGAAGSSQDGDVQQQWPFMVDSVDGGAAVVLRGHYGMEGRVLVDILLVFRIR